jgi:hypothetical protein
VNDDDQARAKDAQTMRAVVQDIRDRWPARIELIAIQAKIAKARFDALRREGFDVSQSLQLCVKAWEQ